MTLIAAADGSALGNPGPAGWAWFIDKNRWRRGGWQTATNNQAELMAVLSLLQETREAHDQELLVLCDSQYVINSITVWIDGWKAKNWRKSNGKPVLNASLIKEIDNEMQGRNVKFQWVKGHAGHHLNEIVDDLARDAATSFARSEAFNAGPGFAASAQTSTPSIAAAEPNTLF